LPYIIGWPCAAVTKRLTRMGISAEVHPSALRSAQTDPLRNSINGRQAPVEEAERDAASTGSTGRPSIPRTVADGRFKIGKKLGSGSYSEVHAGTDLKTGEKVAAKFEWTQAEKTGKLLAEAKLCQIFKSPSIPRVRWVGSEGEYNIMVMDVCGSSLEDLMDKCGGSLSVRTVLRLGIQMVNMLQYVHSFGILHRDIKPNNFLMGVGANEERVYIVDFGLAKRFRDPETGEHIPCSMKKGLTGTVRYTTHNVHKGLEPARRDDLGSVGYVLLYLLRGRLPWQGISARSKKTKQRKIGRRKERVSHAELCEGFPFELVQYLTYCDELAYDKEPNYSYLKHLLSHALESFDAQHGPAQFDWAMPTHVVTSKRARSPQAIQLEEPVDDAARSESGKRRKLKDSCWRRPEENHHQLSKTTTVDGRVYEEAPYHALWNENVPSEEEYDSYEYDYHRSCDEEEEEEESISLDEEEDVEEEAMDELGEEEEDFEEEEFDQREALPTFRW